MYIERVRTNNDECYIILYYIVILYIRNILASKCIWAVVLDRTNVRINKR